MKYVITGGAGNTSKPITMALLKAGHQVTVISRNKNNLEELSAAGASTVIGSVEDAAFLTEALLQLQFTGHAVKYIAGDERSGEDIAKVLGTAAGKPDLRWIMFTDEQTLQGMLQAGLPHEIAARYVEMGGSLRSGKMTED